MQPFWAIRRATISLGEPYGFTPSQCVQESGKTTQTALVGGCHTYWTVVCNCMNKKAVCVCACVLGLQQLSLTLWARRAVLVTGAAPTYSSNKYNHKLLVLNDPLLVTQHFTARGNLPCSNFKWAFLKLPFRVTTCKTRCQYLSAVWMPRGKIETNFNVKN